VFQPTGRVRRAVGSFDRAGDVYRGENGSDYAQPYQNHPRRATTDRMTARQPRGFKESLTLAKCLRPWSRGAGGRIIGTVSLACVGGNLCAVGAVNLLLEIRCVHSRGLRAASDIYTDP